MYATQYQNIDAKKSWSMGTVLVATSVASVAVGASVGLLSASSTNLYAPSTTTTTPAASTAVVTPSQFVQPVQASKYDAFARGPLADEAVDTTQTTFSWGPVAALIGIPAAIAGFLLNQAKKQKAATAGLVASAVIASGATVALPASAAENISGLVPCAESKKFEKNLKKEVKALEKREKLYEPGSVPYLALEATKARTEARFAKYAEKGLLCGEDGFPHLISDPGLAVRYGHAGEVFLPTFGFLYVAGYIGTAGRSYLQEIGKRQKPTQNEIIIDVPLASSIAFKSWDWPRQAFVELANGKLTESDDRVPVSPR